MKIRVTRAAPARTTPTGERPRGPLPPGQRWVEGFPRFGYHLTEPPPAVPAAAVIDVGGALITPFALAVGDLANLPRTTVTADFHCVSGWSAPDLLWEGVAFRMLYETRITPGLAPGVVITHVTFRGLDGIQAVTTLEDVLGEDVLIADTLDGRPLTSDHGAPVRLVSPWQYGYVNIKHLCRITLDAGPPPRPRRPRSLPEAFGRLLAPHPRARVWEEERHRVLPSWVVRPTYQALRRIILWRNP
ncbi:MAG TPA: molybdopterin-dependent oxidoreductase [Euzebyales bacterium]|nr:molybdopterin-dependent oxidoreductase [Euzebyales bacterium]